ncbi:MAG: RIP metalloprotease RseP [Phototrophicales bacterium]|nr:MAG: RIP metalloprotease RseP [Phototrophicales bacterium]
MFESLIGNDFLLTLIAFIIVLIPAVIVHELGHLLAAKAVGITVLEFGIGFPPRVAKLFRWGETEFTLNIIPLGGFVRPLGEDLIRPLGEEATERQREQLVNSHVEEMERKTSANPPKQYLSEREELAQRGVLNPTSIYEVKPLPRIFFMAAGAIANFIFALLIFIIIGLIGLPTQMGSRIGVITLDDKSAWANAGVMQGDWITRINGEFIENHIQFEQLIRQNEGKTITIQVRRFYEDDTFEDLTLSTMVTTDMVAQWDAVNSYVFVASVEAGSPADIAGLLPEDLIMRFNDVSLLDTVSPVDELKRLTDAHLGKMAILQVLRGDEILDFSVNIRANPAPGQGAMGIGILSDFTTPDRQFAYIQSAEYDYIPSPIIPSIEYGIRQTLDIFARIAEFPARLLGGELSGDESRVISALGVGQMGGVVLQDAILQNRIGDFLQFIALISIALGFTNLLPIPALDGGRIVFALIELVRGKPISPEREGYVHMVGFILLLSLGVLLIINDVINPASELIR